MEIEQSTQGDVTVFRLVGELELSSCREVDTELRTKLGEQPSKVVIDLKDTKYVDSSGLGILVSLYSHIRKKGGQMAMCNANRSVRRLFDLTNVQKFLPLYDSQDEAVASLA